MIGVDDRIVGSISFLYLCTMSGRHTDMTKYIGHRFNYLEVIDLEIRQGKTQRYTYFKCRCICGVGKSILANNVKSGVTKSCGCKKKELIKSTIKSYYTTTNKNPVENRLYSQYKTDSKRHKNREFSLGKVFFINAVNSNCHYCGTHPNTVRSNKTGSVLKKLNGLDRVDSKLGYSEDNVVPCCKDCNTAKLDRTEEDFKDWIKRLYQHQFGLA